MSEDRLEDWPDDLRAIFAALGKLMGTRRLSPEMCDVLGRAGDRIVPGHVVRLKHLSKKELGQSTGRYVLELQGERWVAGGQWDFFSGELERLSRAAASEIGNQQRSPS